MKQEVCTSHNVAFSFTHTLLFRLFILFLSLFQLSIIVTTNAQTLNSYNYFCIYSSSSLDAEGIEDVASCLISVGFNRIDLGQVNQMPPKEKARLLIVGVIREDSYTIVSFEDFLGTEVYGFSVKNRSAYRTSRKNIMEKIKDLHYNYDPSLVSPLYYPEFTFWTDSEFQEYYKGKDYSSIEGIYKNYTPSDDQSTIAIIDVDGRYYGLVIDASFYSTGTETAVETFFRGAVRLELNEIEKNVYDITYNLAKDRECKWRIQKSLGTYKDGILSFDTGNGTIDGKYEYRFIKTFPKKDIKGSSKVASTTDSSLKGTGSGFVISSNIIATNYHVIEKADKIMVGLSINGTLEEFEAKVLATDKNNDIALINITDKKFKPFKTVPYKILPNTIDVGTSIFTMGYPLSQVLGNEVKITDGLISSKTGYEGDIVTYQISAPIQPGNSGGALFDKKGHLVGITNAGISSADNIGYAIKSSYLLSLIDSAPIKISLPKGSDMSNKELPAIVKMYSPYIAFIKVY